MTAAPLVSVVINNYNYARYLAQAIDSALGQTYPGTEVVVVDDGSSDGSRDVIAAYGTRVVPVLKENGGQASAFNAGFAASRGDVVLFLDADDCLLPTAAAHRADRVDLRMGRDVVVGDGRVLGLGQDRSVRADQDRAERTVSVRRRRLAEDDGPAQMLLVGRRKGLHRVRSLQPRSFTVEGSRAGATSIESATDCCRNGNACARHRSRPPSWRARACPP